MAKSALIQHVIRTDRYILSRVRPDAAVNDLLATVEQPHDVLMVRLGARNQADNAELDARGFRDYHRARVEARLVPFGFSVAGHFGNRTAEGYTRLLPVAPSGMTSQGHDDFPKTCATLKAAIAHKDTPKELKQAGDVLIKEIGAYEATHAAWTTKAAELVEAEKEVDKAVGKCLDGHSAMRGLLQARFPRQRKVVASYFPFAKKAAAVKDEGGGEKKDGDAKDGDAKDVAGGTGK